VVCQSVCHATVLCKTAERIDVLFFVETLADPRHDVVDGGSDPPMTRGLGFMAAFTE